MLIKIKIQSVRIKKLSKYNDIVRCKWYEKLDNFIDLDTNKIELLNEVFRTGNVNLDLRRLHDETKNNHVVVKKISEDKYELVMGIAAYCRSKILDKTVKALVTDLTRKEFVESLNK